MTEVSPRHYLSLYEWLVNVLPPLVSSLRDVFSLYRASEAIEEGLLARAAGRGTAKISGSVMVKIVVPIP